VVATDRIVKQVLLKAPLDRVWRAVSDSAEFGRWFGMAIDGPFVAGREVSAVIEPTTVDDEVAARQAPHAGRPSPLHVVTVEPQRRLAFRWHPLAGTDHAELTTLVEFTLSEVDGGVLLEIVESGFDALPQDLRTPSFRDNSEGWTIQTRLIGRYLKLYP
jgi:uncharacterized protein YndB with AHSA1/START domain